ncbi:uncharacterized protein B0H64DRAFT_416990 [Chaetomium fimeti]|uniref:Peptidase M14 domain-containing protein n=1 Tax=Chaetomium fimeti TaxID=1854472 RepID=A0AAE0HEX3_9PEZI|nr:hypothetical protein B0H64DRAFT_416990 [Chaetomium fimeti]
MTLSGPLHQRPALVSSSWFNKYHDYQAHVEYLHDLSKLHRRRSGIHLFGKSGPGIKPAVVFFGTMHAREWIGTMVTEYIAHNLLQLYGVDGDVKHALDSFDFYIFPVVNPDGFVHSQTANRMWRKNRQTQPDSPCVGRDLNRNWDIHWASKGGASPRPCRSTYRGDKPFDAPETRALATELEAIKARQGIRLFIDWHAFGQLVMYPYSYACDKQLPPFSAVRWLGAELAGAMGAAHGTEYRAGAACELLYAASGDSADWAFEVLGVDYAYTVELRPGLRGRGPGGAAGAAGFRLPERHIRGTAEEAWAGVRHVLRFVHRY